MASIDEQMIQLFEQGLTVQEIARQFNALEFQVQHVIDTRDDGDDA